MTMPHLMNCDHSEEGWCLPCVQELWETSQAAANDSIAHGTEEFLLRKALSSARTYARENGLATTRQFAAWCGVSPSQLSEWTSDEPSGPPDFVRRSK